MIQFISLFTRGHRDVIPQVTSEEQLVQAIAHDRSVKDLTQKHRYCLSRGDTKSAKFYKSQLPCFAVAVTFEGGKKQENIVRFTGCSLCDIDDLPLKQTQELMELVRCDPHTRLAYTTASERGIRIEFSYQWEDGTDLNAVFQEDPQKAAKLYAHAFAVGNEYYRRVLGLEKTDLKCKDCTRLSGIAHDPQVYYNPDAEPLVIPPLPKEQTHSISRKQVVTLSKALPAVTAILNQRNVSYVPGQRNAYISQAGYLLNQYGVPLTEAVDWAEATFADYEDLPCAADIIRSCYNRTDEHATEKVPVSRSTGKYANVDEIEQFLTLQADYRFNVITRKCELKWKGTDNFKEMTDRDGNTLWLRMCRSVMAVRLNDLYNVLHSEFVSEFNPFVDYIENLPEWDGQTDYLAQLAATVHVANGKQEVFEEYFRRWFVAILPTLLDVRVVNHEILVLVGKQGVYKTTWLRHLLPPPLQSYFHTKTNSNRLTKDDLFTLSESAIVCFEELETMNHSELNQLKAMTTIDFINERAAYGRNKERRPHIASFCATCNSVQFLSDDSGNRRFLTFEVENIDPPQEHPVNYEGVYSQAKYLWQNGYRYWFDPQEIDEINEHNRYYEVPNLEEELILTYFCKPVPGESGKFMSVANILERISMGIREPLSKAKIGRAMVKLGFEYKKMNNLRGYLVIERTLEQVKFNQINMGHYLSD